MVEHADDALAGFVRIRPDDEVVGHAEQAADEALPLTVSPALEVVCLRLRFGSGSHETPPLVYNRE
jgi:hypothetical protein